MRRPVPFRRYYNPQLLVRAPYSTALKPPIVQIKDATFYRQYPQPDSPHESNNPPLFPNLTFSIPSFSPESQHWSIIGPSSSGKTTFLEILRGQHLSFPPTARSYPYLATDEIAAKNLRLRFPGRALQHVGFAGESGGLAGTGTRGAYLSARYESRREETDFSLLDFLKGHTELNPAEDGQETAEDLAFCETVIHDLRLESLVDMPVSNLSNGQMRRARIAKALLGKPEVLLLDEPFMGLDPPTLTTLSPLLHRLAENHSPRLLLTLRPQDPIPDWITHLCYLGPDCTIEHQGSKENVLAKLKSTASLTKIPIHTISEVGRTLASTGIIEDSTSSSVSDDGNLNGSAKIAPGGSGGEPLVEMEGVKVSYGDKQVLGTWKQDVDGDKKDGLWWTIRRGERWGIFGPNGSGKTTILSLMSSDHPQTYSLPIRLFGRSRLPQPGQPGISIFDIQSRMGQSSPEIHAFFPKFLTVRQTLENAWSDTFLARPQLNHERDLDVDAALRWFAHELNPSSPSPPSSLSSSTSTTTSTSSASPGSTADQDDLDWADSLLFGQIPFSAQRVALFLRAVIKHPDLVILDEAFSGMDDYVRDKCLLFLEFGESMTFASPSPASSSSSSSSASPSPSSSSASASASASARARASRSPRGSKAKATSPRSSAPPASAAAAAAAAAAENTSPLYPGRTTIPTPANTTIKPRLTGLKPHQALVCISHVREEIPSVVREWMCLPEPNERDDEGRAKGLRLGRLSGPLGRDQRRWNQIWGM